MENITKINVGGVDYEVRKDLADKIVELQKQIQQGTGSGGTTDYTDLENKPQINGHELSGDQSSEDLGLQQAGNYALKSEIPDTSGFATKDELNNITPTIGENGNWFINGVDTGKPANGKDGADGVSLGEIALVQETGTESGSDNKVMSQKAVSEKLTELDKKSFLWGKANQYEPYGWDKTEDGLWYFNNNFLDSPRITIPFTSNDNDCLAINLVAYSQSNNDDMICLQVYDKTDSKYLTDNRINLKTTPSIFPLLVKGLESGHNYEVYIGKLATQSVYYIACPLTYYVGPNPALIHFLHDVDKDLDELRSDVNANNSNLQGQIDVINGAFTNELKYGKKVENYTTATTALFDNIPFSDLDDVNYTLELKSSQQFRFTVYAVQGTSPFTEIIDIDKGTDFSQGYVCPQTIDIKSLREQGYDNLKFRTYETDINLDYSIYYMKKTVSAGNTSDWKNAIAALFGNSIVAKCNGDFEGYYDPSWGGIFATKLGLAKLYARGVGGQTYRWNDNCFYIKSGSTGNYVNRWKVKNGVIDTTAGVVTISTTEEEKQAIEAVLGYPIEIHRGCYCSWDRITSMFPASIKDSINCVCIMGGTNDFSGVEDVEGGDLNGTLQPQWSSENQLDTDWMSAEGYYNGGDYDISNTWGAMASCLMKMQIWMPQAKIIVLIPIIRKGVEFNNPVNTNGVNMQTFNENLKKIADWCNVEVIDMSVCGITQFNSDTMIPDGFHPGTLEANTRMGNHLAAKFNCIAKI